MTPQRITMVTLGVSDLARSRAYYAALGWQEEEANDMVAFYSLGGMKLGLFTLDGLAHETGIPRDRLGTGAMTLAQNYPSEPEVDAAWAAAVDAGATPLAKPRKADWGGYSGYVADPDGHVWEYAMNPFWPLDQDGRLKQ